VNPLLSALPPEIRQSLKRSEHPSWVEPMLAELTDRAFPVNGWLFERKLDGERCIASCTDTRVRLASRNRKILNNTYPEIVEAFRNEHAGDFIVDGEIVALIGNIPKFSALQGRLGIVDPDAALIREIPVYYYLFDILYLDGYDIMGIPLSYRKEILHRLFTFTDPIRFTGQREGMGAECFREACDRGFEGVIAKRMDSRYIQRRSGEWLKFKCLNRQEFVVGGYTDPKGGRMGFGALLIGYFEGDNLIYAGKVGTGFDEATLRTLYSALRSIGQETSPFQKVTDTKGVHFVHPVLIAEIGFSEWTSDGKLRHPRFIGLRYDKESREVIREEPRH
jgi:bifunctional non-homologous end joining protein LigD